MSTLPAASMLPSVAEVADDAHSLLLWLSLTKPGITGFITITAACGYLLGGGTSRHVLLVTLMATAAAAAGAAAFNQVVEHERDARMTRTRNRPLATGRIGLWPGLVFASVLTAIGLLTAALALPVSTAALLAVSTVSYVGVYTPLKCRSALCTVVGGIPGALPVLAGWCASGAPVSRVAVGLAGLMFAWQMPHFLSIGWLCRDDYARAGFRVLGVYDASGRASALASLVCAAALPLLVWLLYHDTAIGLAQFLAATALSAGFVGLAVRFAMSRTGARARQLFLGSLAYLPLVFGVLVAG